MYHSEVRRIDALPRSDLLRCGYFLAGATVAWNVIEGIVAVIAGTEAESVALIAFGVDSFIETASAAVVGWRLRKEMHGRSPRDAEVIEHRAARTAGALLLFLSIYIVIDASLRLFGIGGHASESRIGIALTAVSLILMPVLAWGKLRVGGALNSRALRADAYETITCMWLSLTTLGGVVLTALFQWWWADPLAALTLVPLIAREGIEAWQNESDEQGG